MNQGAFQGRGGFYFRQPGFRLAMDQLLLSLFPRKNPFGFSARRIGDLYAGMEKDFFGGSRWKKFRKTAHTHHPVDDALGNAEALLEIRELGLKFPF
jgi:hypothetical protein